MTTTRAAAAAPGDPVMSSGPAASRSRRAPCTAPGTRDAGDRA